MTQLFETKSMLGRLLASENLIIQHANVPTAYFDLKNRTITLPKLKEMTGELYDLLVGHEVSHALHTPAQGWHDAVEEDSNFKTYLNVIEDARIERKIKNKFPGIRRSFNIAYKKLNDEDFFGIAAKDVNKMLLIDRINIFYKLGAHVRVSFSEDELPYIDEINAAETWEQVVEVARKIYNKTKEDLENNKIQMPSDSLKSESDDNDDGEYGDYSDDYDDSDDSDDDDEDDSDDDSDGDGDGDGHKAGDDLNESENSNKPQNSKNEKDSAEESESNNSASKGHGKNVDINDISSKTDNAFRSNEQSLFDTSNGKTFILKTPIYNGKHIIDYKKVQKCISDVMSKDKNAEKLTSELFSEFNKRTNPVVNYMVKEFEMRKNASQLARAKVGKSGKINPNKLSRYTMASDIFKRTTIIPQGKNHGLVMFIDLSGSMCDIIGDTFEQVIILTQFCKKVNIPFEVYGFSDKITSIDKFRKLDKISCNTKTYQEQENVLDLNNRNFHLKQYLTNTMSPSEYRKSVLNMLYVINSHKSYYQNNELMETEGLSGTPLDEAIVASMDIVEKFKNSYRLDNVNCIFLTDGEGGLNTRFFVKDDSKPNDPLKMNYATENDTMYIENPKTKHRVKVEGKIKKGRRSYEDYFRVTRALIELAKLQTNAKYTGYYIGSRRYLSSKIVSYHYDCSNDANYNSSKNLLNKILDKNGFLSSDKFGFNEYFLVQDKNLKITENTFEVNSNATKNVIGRAFIKSLKGRGLQRMFLNQFMQNIAA